MKVKPGVIVAIVGSSQSGKTAYTKNKIAKAKRVLTWDIEGQYPGTVIRTKKALVAHIKKVAGGNAVISYQAKNLNDFDFFCRVAYAWGLLGEQAGVSTVIVAEETADVTNPGKAPQGWGVLLRRGKKRGISIYAITQRLSESDKTAIGNADYVHACRLVLSNDRKAVANVLDVPLEQVKALLADQDKAEFDYLQKDLGRDKLQPGRLTFTPKGKAKFSHLLH